MAGAGVFRRGVDRVPFGPGDFLFVPARVPHAFETFSADFKTWVIFFGPQGGYSTAAQGLEAPQLPERGAAPHPGVPMAGSSRPSFRSRRKM
ncbi:cupin domain-containing protein [Bradyrhizobium iriomotense]|uniref:Cupin 2 conserved barrel domain-containing protein n=1 Tax=Bradyrhizobium iriomotense TaxID=441950 RepID=A0ABQ6BGD1_9BRAD|nr:hypothetical protein GCM10007857_83590 [Bradyrhizobium iriomotense]